MLLPLSEYRTFVRLANGLRKQESTTTRHHIIVKGWMSISVNDLLRQVCVQYPRIHPLTNPKKRKRKSSSVRGGLKYAATAVNDLWKTQP